VLAGVGGSGIVGDILADYCRDAVPIPIIECRSVKIPAFVGPKTLFVSISYSGETTETFHMFEQARLAGASLVAVCSGGKLLETSQAKGIPYVRVKASLLPRVALPEMVAAVTHVLGEAKIIAEPRRLLERAAASMTETIREVRSTVPLTQNKAKEMAAALVGRLPILIGGEENVSVLRRFKNELNENSKVPAFFYTIPEAFHDDIEGFRSLAQLTQPQPILLRGLSEGEEEARLRESLADLLTKLDFSSPLSFSGLGKGRFEWLLSAITFGDFVSFYLAMLNGVDPSKLNLIPRFRQIRGQV
jgi:glucose/mannose-6-phosphate isomerase